MPLKLLPQSLRLPLVQLQLPEIAAALGSQPPRGGLGEPRRPLRGQRSEAAHPLSFQGSARQDDCATIPFKNSLLQKPFLKEDIKTASVCGPPTCGVMGTVVLSEVAYTKVLLHAQKYPHCAVDGFLVGSSSASSGPPSLTVDDALPLFHNGTTALLLEAATSMAEEHARSLSKSLVGYYFANAHLEDESVPAVAPGILGPLEAALAAPVCQLQLSNKRLADPRESGLVARTRRVGDAGSWNEELRVEATATSRYLDVPEEVGVVDFDLHFNDVTKDWRNQAVDDWLKA